MKKIFYFEKHVKIEKESHELFKRVEEVSKDESRDVKNQSLEIFDKVICFDKISMKNFDNE